MQVRALAAQGMSAMVHRARTVTRLVGAANARMTTAETASTKSIAKVPIGI
jgi:hypothetical protein